MSRASLVTTLLPLLLFAVGLPVGASAFIENVGQIDTAVLFFATGPSSAVYFTADAVVLVLRDADANPARGAAVRLRFAGGRAPAALQGRARQEAVYHFFRGKDAERWRTRVPAYAEVAYEKIWPGIDLVFRGDAHCLSYEVVAAPGADLERVELRFEGVTAVHEKNDGIQWLDTGIAPIVHTRASGWRERGEIALSLQKTRDPALCDDPSRLVWSTFLGGSTQQSDGAVEVGVNAMNQPLVIGATSSPDFPLTAGAYDTLYGGSGDITVTLLDATGMSVIWSSYLGGASRDYALDFALDAQKNIVVCGATESADFPVTPEAYDTTGSGTDAFVAKLSADGDSLLWGTYLGGSDLDECRGVDVDALGNVVVGGRTHSPDFPVTPGAVDQTPLSNAAFVSKFRADGTGLLWSTFFDAAQVDDLRLDEVGNPVVAGMTTGDCPTTPGAYDTTFNGNVDVFIGKLDVTGSNLLWSTYLGGTGGDIFPELARDNVGNLVVAGTTTSSDFPTKPGAFDADFNGGDMDLFVAVLDDEGTSLLTSTYLGGDGVEWCYDLELDMSGAPIVTGYTWSPGFPTTVDAYDRTYNGDSDAFIAQLHASGHSLLWSSFLGGAKRDWGLGVAVDAAGALIATGTTRSADFPTTPGAYDTVFDGGGRDDAYVVKLTLPLPAPSCRVVPDSLNFGEVALGGHRDEGFTIINTGVVPLTGEVSETCAEFVLLSGSGAYSLLPGEQHHVVVRFSPVSVGTKLCDVETGNEACTDVFCTGDGTAAGDCWVDPIDIHFGIVLVGSFQSERFSIVNTGSADLNLHIDLAQPSESYVIVSGGGDVVLKASETQLVVVRFGPISAGLAACTILTGLNGPCSSVSCDGYGEVPAPVVNSPAHAALSVRPNPLNPGAEVSFALAVGGWVRVMVYDLQGRQVSALADRDLSDGFHVLTWNGTDDNGRALPSGRYFLRLRAPGRSEVCKLTLVR